MAKEFFFLNYGGPGGYFIADTEALRADLIAACIDYYGGEWVSSKSNVMINGLSVTVYTFGVHRALGIELPENLPALSDQFFHLKNQALQLCSIPYSLLTHNCATAVAKIIHGLDPNIMAMDLISPWGVDAEFNLYSKVQQHYADSPPSVRAFIHYYEKKAAGFNFFTPYWTKTRIKSLEELIRKSHENTFEERTRAALFEMGWIKGMDSNRRFIVGDKAPEDFRQGLEKFYSDRESANSENNPIGPRSLGLGG